MEQSNKPKLELTEEQLNESNSLPARDEQPEVPTVKSKKEEKKDEEKSYDSDRHSRVPDVSQERAVKDDFGGFSPVARRDVPADRLKDYDAIEDSLPLPTSDNTVVGDFTTAARKAVGALENERDRNGVVRDQIIGNNGATASAIRTTGSVIQYKYYEDNLKENKENMVNSVVYGDNELNARQLKIGSNGGAVEKHRAVALFTSLLGMGEVVQIPLWNSGIWISVKPPKQKDLVSLETRIAIKEGELGRETSTLIYNNRSVIINNIVIDFVLDHVIDTSVTLKDEVTLKDLILVSDLNQLVLGVICGMFPRGFNITKPCLNSLVLDENQQIKCNYKLVGTLDPKKLLWVNKKALSQKMLEHMKNKRPNSVTVDAVREYQLDCAKLAPKEIELKKGDDISLKAELKTPTLRHYLDAGNKWVDEIVSNAEAMFTDEDNAESRKEYIDQLAARLVLGSYNSWVSKLSITKDGETSTTVDPDAIHDILGEFYSDDEIFKSFLNQIKDYISNAYVSIVGTPSYKCPACQKENKHDGMPAEFEQIVPLDAMTHFFALSVMMKARIQRDSIY